MNVLRRSFYPLLLLLFACGRKEAAIHPEETPITESVYASAAIKARGQYDVYASVTGIIDRVLVREGGTVSAGQPLLVLRQEVQRLNAANAAIGATYGDAARNADRLAEARSSIDAARSRLQTDSALYARQRALWNDGIGTRSELDNRELAWRTSADNYAAAGSRYSALARSLQQQEASTRTGAALGRAQLDEYTVRSRMSGLLYRMNREAGELVGPQTPIATVGAADDFYLELQVDEYDIARIRPGLPVLVQMDSYKGQVFEARVTRVDPIMNERTRTFTVEADFQKRPGQLYPNLTAEANIVLQAKPRALTIPRAYLLDEGHVLLEGRRKVAVRTGVRDYQRVEILSGITAADALIKPAP